MDSTGVEAGPWSVLLFEAPGSGSKSSDFTLYSVEGYYLISSVKEG
jgi:hypothetical protein